MSLTDAKEDIGVKTFRNYLRINTMHPDPNYNEAVIFLQNLASDVGLICKVVQVAPKKPVVILSLPGENPTLPSIMLNSHMDVVPVYPEHWTHDPFGAYKDENGNIFARGAQDMKCVGVQYIEAIRRLKNKSGKFLRTIHITFVPDEEIGGQLGMELFIKTVEFQQLKVGFYLDEGLAAPVPHCYVFYGERVKWWLQVTCSGCVGHGSRLIQNTAAEKFQKVVTKFLEFRESEFAKLTDESSLGDVITVNLTMISGGVQVNIIPAELVANFDIRVPPTCDQKAIKSMFENMAMESSSDIKLEWIQHYECNALTSISKTDKWWKSFSEALDETCLQHKETIFPGGTDARYLRTLGIPALGFSPMPNTPTLLHEHDEYLNEAVFLRGIEIYEKIISSLANVL